MKRIPIVSLRFWNPMPVKLTSWLRILDPKKKRLTSRRKILYIKKMRLMNWLRILNPKKGLTSWIRKGRKFHWVQPRREGKGIKRRNWLAELEQASRFSLFCHACTCEPQTCLVWCREE